jgi:glycosyltransferase involved in cell wall biosynthesis
MYQGKTIALILPARNEAISLPIVLKNVPPVIDYVLVIDNGSTDSTSQVAREYGAQVVAESKPGYGRACLAGIAALKISPPDVVAFADSDGSDDLSQILDLLGPVVDGHADMVLGSRIPTEFHALSIQQRFGNWLATTLIHLIWGHRYKDLGPMRAINWIPLLEMKMRDENYGWTVEMQIKALKSGLRIREYAVSYRPRAGGCSKISRTLEGTIRAGVKILWVIGREAFRRNN